MQAAIRITKNAIVMAEKQIFRALIQLGSMTNGSSSSYVRLVVMPYLEEIAKINEIIITDQPTTTERCLFECGNESIVIHSANSRVVKNQKCVIAAPPIRPPLKSVTTFTVTGTCCESSVC